MTAAPAGLGAHPDAAVLQACAEFDRLERAWLATRWGCEETDPPTWEAAEAERARLVEEQRVWLDRICAATVTTAAGVLAIVGSLVVWASSEPDSADDRDDYFDARLIGALRRANAGILPSAV